MRSPFWETLFWRRIRRFGDALSQLLDRMRREPQRHAAAVGIEEDEQRLSRVVVVVALPELDQVDEPEGVVDRQGMRYGRGASSGAIVGPPV
jgi:hypothetical protein